jgi:hypothetical protein
MCSSRKTKQAWVDLKNRCNNERHPSYRYYGGRGIGYEARWELFSNFLADMGEAPQGLAIDRIDNNGDYTAQNCRWVTQEVNNRNSGRVKLSADIARLIRTSLQHVSTGALAYQYNVTRKAIQSVRNNTSWSNV